VARAPAGAQVSWDAEIINEIEGELIAWRTVDDADVRHTGSVHFRPSPDNGGTVVTVVFQYDPPGGRFGAAIARLFGEEPSQQVEEDLRRFKRLMETGEVSPR
jgi:uncharacterized membrane protein